MTQADDKNTYGQFGAGGFVFQAAIDKATSDYPEALSGTTFINSSSLASHAQLVEHFKKKVIPLLQHETTEDDALLYADRILNKEAIASSLSNLLAMYTRKSNCDLLAEGRVDSELSFTFFHELAHILMPNDLYKAVIFKMEQETADTSAISAFVGHRYRPKFEDLGTNIAEAQADCFAAITGLRDGWLTVEDVLHVAAIREAAIPHDTEARHLTHFALRALTDEYHPGKYDGMTPQQVVDTAYMHGKIYAATTADIKSAKSVSFNQPAKKYNIEIIDAPNEKANKNIRKPGSP